MTTRRIPIISLWQPWGSLIILGEKEYETRHWTPSPNMLKPGDLMGIHAAKTLTKETVRLCWSEPYKSTLTAHGITNVNSLLMMSRGTLLGVVRVLEFVRTEKAIEQISPLERAFGNYNPKRWAWRVEVVHRYTEPIPMMGRQTMFFADVPDWEVVAPEIPEQTRMFD